jgi:predicted O-linked N-acetylglucosamine transferase (SPINDLY family)
VADGRGAQDCFSDALALHRAGRPSEAIPLYRQAIGQDPAFVDAYHNCGIAHAALGQIGEAIECYAAALNLEPGDAGLWANRGLAWSRLGQFAKACADYRAAIDIDGDVAEFHIAHAQASEQLGDIQAALSGLARAAELSPSRADVHAEHGRLLSKAGAIAAALGSLDQAIALAKDFAPAHYLRANCLQVLGRYEEALLSADKAIAIAPDLAVAHYLRGDILWSMRRLEPALASYGRTLELDPHAEYCAGQRLHLMMQLCDWSAFDENLAALCDLVRSGARACMPFVLLALVDDDALHASCAATYLANIAPQMPAAPPQQPYPKHDRIRIGYFSADFHDHATMHLMADLFEAHDRSRFEIIGISCGAPKMDRWRKRARAAFDAFHDVHLLSDVEIARLSRDLEIDIAVDLKGFTKGHRLAIFAHRAAPVQATYLGFPGTMSTGFIDYVIADSVVIPEESRPLHHEKLVALPPTYFPHCRTRQVSDQPVARADFGLPGGAFVYCSLNQNYKITPDLFTVWMHILDAVPNSVLWLWVDAPEARSNLDAAARARGIDSDRLVYADRLAAEHHLARLPLADLFLDTRPCGAHTTATDALYMNVPVLTCPGRTFASRVGASLLTALGMPELIAETLDDYQRLAIELGTDPIKLAEIRDRLVAGKTDASLFDPERLARNFESAFEAMIARHRDGLAPDHIVLA